jgi:hypothetical protein
MVAAAPEPDDVRPRRQSAVGHGHLSFAAHAELATWSGDEDATRAAPTEAQVVIGAEMSSGLQAGWRSELRTSKRNRSSVDSPARRSASPGQLKL